MREFRVICEYSGFNYGSLETFQRMFSKKAQLEGSVNLVIRDSKTDWVLLEERFSINVALKLDPQEYCKRIQGLLIEKEENPWKTKFEDLSAQVEDLLRFTKEVKVLPHPIKNPSDDRIKEISRFIERSMKIHR